MRRFAISQHLPNRSWAIGSEYLLEVGSNTVVSHAAITEHCIIRLEFCDFCNGFSGDIAVKTGNQIIVSDGEYVLAADFFFFDF